MSAFSYKSTSLWKSGIGILKQKNA